MKSHDALRSIGYRTPIRGLAAVLAVAVTACSDPGSGGGQAGAGGNGGTGGGAAGGGDGAAGGGPGGAGGGAGGGGGGGGLPPASCSSWERKADVPAVDYHDLDWLDADRAFAVGATGTAISTGDGGKTWVKVEVGTKENLRTVDFAPGADADHGWIVGGIPVDSTTSAGTTIRRTDDGGKTWKGQSSGINFPPTRVKALDAKRGWIVWGLGKFHPDGHWNRTVDGGSKWQMGDGDFYRPGRALMDIFFVDDKEGWAVGSNSTVMITIGGKPLETPIAGKGKLGGIVHTKDGGLTWELQKTEITALNYFMGVYFVDPGRGWIVDDAGNIFGTEDSGAAWTKQTSGVSTTLRGLYFGDASVGWVVGDKGVILHTRDGGKTWTAQTSGTTNDLTRIAASRSGSPWIVGKGGIVLGCAAP